MADVKQMVLSLAGGGVVPQGMCRQWARSHADLVRAESLAPWLYRSLANQADCGLDPAIAAEFQQCYRLSSFACFQREMALRELLDAFHRDVIPIVLLKGTYLANCVYKDPASRPMVDVDILVREGDLHVAERQLRRLGYKRLVNPSLLEHQVLLAPRPYSLSGPNSVMIDLHHGIRLIDYYRFPFEVLWSHRVEAELFAHKVFYLSPELNFIHLALHNLNHLGSIRDWLDLLLMLRTIDLDWDRVIELAQDIGATRPLSWALQDLSQQWEIALPEHVAQSFDAYVPRWLEDRMIRHRLRYFWRHVGRMTLFEGWRDRARYALQKLIPALSGPFRGTVLNWMRTEDDVADQAPVLDKFPPLRSGRAPGP